MKKSFDIKEYLKENKIEVGIDDGMNIKQLNEISSDAFERMNGLVKTNDLKSLKKSVKSIFKELRNEGFDDKEISDFIKRLYLELRNNI